MKKGFERSFDLTMKHEGGYADNPLDRGGETYRGISRRFHPSWNGWRYIDIQKERYGDIVHNHIFPELEDKVKEFYYVNFWERSGCDRIEYHKVTDGFCDRLFDTSVNCGVGRAVKFLQRGLNASNSRGRYYVDLIVDGQFGDKTLAAILAADNVARFFLVMTIFTILRGNHYVAIMEEDSSQEVFAYTWLTRLKIFND